MKKKVEPIPEIDSNHHQFRKEVAGILILALALFLFFANQYQASTGIIGNFFLGSFLNFFIGTGKNILPFFIAVTGLILLFGSGYTREGTRIPGIIYGFIIYLIYLEMESGLVNSQFALFPIMNHSGGIIGYFTAFLLRKLFGFTGVKIFLVSSVFISLLLIFKATFLESMRFLARIFYDLYRIFSIIAYKIFYKKDTESSPPPETIAQKPLDKIKIFQAQPIIAKEKEKPKFISEKESKIKEEQKAETIMEELDYSNRRAEADEDYQLPDINLLETVPVSRENLKKVEEEIKQTIQKLEETLESFKVSARVVNTSQGPSVTRYEMQPGFGVKVSKIVNLADDIALNLAAKGVRIEAPVPGKSVVGIEIPNFHTQIVSLKPLAKEEKFLFSASPLNIALGKDIEGKSVFIDLAKMPHLLVAGATGSGKSVCVNSIVISLLLRNPPSVVRFIMIDPKKVELSVYDDIPHLIAPVVTDPKQAAVTLRWCVREMEKRYEELAKIGVRNIDGYNKKIDELRKAQQTQENQDYFIPQKHSFIVVIIDELADLMMAAASEVETSIARISQMARAVGIHLVIATQRPSVDVITGLIKANVPSRISFAVSSQIDSRTILDSMGAEKLLGKGDMLYKPVGAMRPTRAQGVFISDQEVHKIVEFVKTQGKPEYLQEVVNLKPEDLDELKAGGKKHEINEDNDEFYEEAKELVIQSKVASISYIQRKLRIGYNRAARIMEQLEEVGIVSAPENDGKSRRVLF